MKYWIQIFCLLFVFPFGFSQQESVEEKPVFGIVELQKKRVYEGEHVLLNGKIFTKYDLAVESYSSYHVNGHPEIKQIPGPNEPIFTPVSIKGQAYFSTQIDRKLLYFGSPGNYQIEPFEMGVVYETADDFINFKFVSTPEIVEVIPLPPNAPPNFIRGIGEFTFTRKIESLKVKQGDVVALTVEIVGTGNVQNCIKPVFDLPEGVVFYGDSEVKELVGYHESGAFGRKIFTFRIQFLESGNFTIPAMELSYFNLKQKKYVTLQAAAIDVDVEKSNQFESQLQDFPTDLSDQNDLSKQSNKNKNSTGKLVILSVLLMLFLVVILYFFLKRKFKKERSKKESKIIVETLVENAEIKKIRSLIFESAHFQGRGDVQSSYHQLELAIRTMLIFASENSNQRANATDLTQQLSKLLVICETARFLESYEMERAQKLQVEINIIFESMQDLTD